MQFIDVSGVGNSGKSAVVDLLREIEGLYAPEYWFEFDFIRVPGGLLDLRHSLLEDWSPIRSHAAYHAFIDVVDKMGVDPEPWELFGLLNSTSQRYDRRFHGQFRELCLQFVERFIIGSYKAEWPFDGLREPAFLRICKKILRRLGARRALTQDVFLLEGKDFDREAKKLLESLYSLIVPDNCDTVVFNNGFEPFNPQPGLEMLSAKQIVVTRDPRDIYVSGLNKHNISTVDEHLMAFDNDGMNKSFLASNDLELYVKRYRLYNEKVFSGSGLDVLRISFEQLVSDPDTYTKNVLEFIDIDPSRHSNAGQFFDPSQSVKNVGIWKSYSKQDEIRYIESELSDFLVNL